MHAKNDNDINCCVGEVQLGENYYPKLQCAVPFSPVPGARLLVAPGEEPAEVRASMLRVLPQVAEALKVCISHC